jgi:hypothetical protein
MELLVMGSSKEVRMACEKCGGEELERVMSSTNFAVKSGASGSSGVQAQARNCSGGNCTTLDIPGPN